MTPNDSSDAIPEAEREPVLVCYRHWLVTPAVLGRWQWREMSPDAIRKSLSRSVEREWLVRHALTEREPYFVLGPRAISTLGLRRSTAALGGQALLEHYAILLACARRRSEIITEAEFRSHFPDLSEPGQSAKNFFVDTSVESPRLGLFVVDHDKLSSRMVGKIGRRVGKILASDRPALRRLVLDGQLAVHIITATEGKRANLEAAFARKPPQNVPVFVEAYPDDLGDFFLVNRR